MTIADKGEHLRELDTSDRAIAVALTANDKTVAKAAGEPGTRMLNQEGSSS